MDNQLTMIAQQEIASAEAVLTQETVQPMTTTDVIAEGPRFLSGAQALMESLIAEGTEVIFGYRAVPSCPPMMPSLIILTA